MKSMLTHFFQKLNNMKLRTPLDTPTLNSEYEIEFGEDLIPTDRTIKLQSRNLNVKRQTSCGESIT